MKRTAQVQLTPKLHLGKLQYYWHIDQETDDGVFTIRHGYSVGLPNAYSELLDESLELQG